MKVGVYLGKQVSARYWQGVLYPENMIDDWQTKIGDLIGLPFCYCIHDKDMLAEYKSKKGDEDEERQRKTHVHLIVAWNNTTTYSRAFTVFNKLSKPGCSALNKIEDIVSIRAAYNYLIHDTETARSQKKYQYSPKERICGNLFDIGAYEQLSTKDKQDMANELAAAIMEHNFYNFGEFWRFVMGNYDSQYQSVLISYNGFFERLTKSNYQRRFLESRLGDSGE